MSQQQGAGIVMRNLRILEALQKGPERLETIAENAGYLPQQVRRGLRQLEEQGIVAEQQGIEESTAAPDNGLYAAVNGDAARVLDMVTPWIEAARESFYEIAKDAARIIMTKSWEGAHIQDVLLFGSTLTSDKPSDIDLLILHSGGHKLVDWDIYDNDALANIQYDAQPDAPGNTRYDGFEVLMNAGYQEGADRHDTVVKHIGERIAHLEMGTLSEDRLRRARENPQSHSYMDVHGIANLFDVHVLNTHLLGVEPNRPGGWLGFMGATYTEEGKARVIAEWDEERARTIASCEDPMYWHTILSTGKLFDVKTGDFTVGIEDKYPGVLELFPSEQSSQ